MTRKQSFALYCKTGVDVRGCTLDRETIDKAFNLPCTESRKLLSAQPGAKVKTGHKQHGDWLYKEYGLFENYAMDLARKAYAEKTNGNGHGDKRGYCLITMTGVNGFARAIGITKKKPYRICIGESLQGNIAAAAAFCEYLYNTVASKDIDYTIINL